MHKIDNRDGVTRPGKMYVQTEDVYRKILETVKRSAAYRGVVQIYSGVERKT